MVGVGPKGLFCLERLAWAVHHSDVRPEVHLFEPHPHPGAGPVYDPGLPRLLCMNVPNRDVDLWPRGEGGAAGDWSGPTFVEWLSESHPDLADPEAFAPRAVVGEYLAAGAREVIDRLQGRVPVSLHPESVADLIRTPRGWSVRTATGRETTVDEVVLAVGHAGRVQRAVGRPAVPVAELDPAAVPAGSIVAMRGFGLTALDACLALEDRSVGDRPARVVPYSRTGRPMAPKLAPAVRARGDALDDLWAEGRRRVGRLAGCADLVALLARVAGRAMEASGAQPGRWAPSRVLRDLLTLEAGDVAGRSPEEALRHHVETAAGVRPWDALRALGETWRRLYPALVSWIEHGGLPVADRPSFGRLCREMERLAFGPPLVTARRILAAVEHGRIDLRWLEGSTMHPNGSGGVLVGDPGAVRADALLDAVLPGPGVGPDPIPPFRGLFAAGHARLHPGTEGVDVLPDGQVIGASGRPTPGLYAVGRPTEGAVLGNDTLSRALHRHPSRWAAGAVRRARPSRTAS